MGDLDVQSKAGEGVLGPRVAIGFALVLTLVLGALSGLVMYPAAQHLRSLQDGPQAEATLVAAGSGCFLGGCKVRFDAEGRTVVANLPVGSSHGENTAGERLTVRYREGDPQVVASQDDVGGGGPAVATVLFGSGAVLFPVIAVWGSVHARRQRRAFA
ncbi:hypothetical protein J3A78_005958 [Streptomyces sp. PvR006]|uniref:DUF3592 domain-containing protein n=1 Tax=Streptomyces sp. PvR006 TaxID=2817860 RepID=UPI0027DE792C|nr:DUF3592 domain-containing protein [Streptomyces sp. PvR006]MBP2585480.1 hypothetical protein [Streptomyces sp. PvR006]